MNLALREQEEFWCEICGHKGAFRQCAHCGRWECPACSFREVLVSQKIIIGLDGYKIPCDHYDNPSRTRYHFETWCVHCYSEHHTDTTIIRLTEQGPLLFFKPYQEPIEIDGMQEPPSQDELNAHDCKQWVRNLPYVRA